MTAFRENATIKLNTTAYEDKIMLVDKQIKNAKNDGSTGKRMILKDNNGLFLEVYPNGRKVWRVRFNINYKQCSYTIGEYPYVSLQEARAKTLEIKNSPDKKPSRNFKELAYEWLALREKEPHSKDIARIIGLVEKHLLPSLGDKPTNQITYFDILTTLKEIENQGKIITMHKAKQKVVAILLYGKSLGEVNLDFTEITQNLSYAIAKQPRNVHRPALTDLNAIRRFLVAIQTVTSTITRNLLMLHSYTFVRPGEIRLMEWSEIDCENKFWKIPSYKMKMGREHIVPLSRQSVEILKKMQEYTGNGISKYVFPQVRNLKQPLSNNTERMAIIKILPRMNLEHQMSAHGFRGMASTILNANGFNSDVIEMALAHSPTNEIRAAYNHYKYLEERIKMMQWYADYLDSLRDGLPTPQKPL